MPTRLSLPHSDNAAGNPSMLHKTLIIAIDGPVTDNIRRSVLEAKVDTNNIRCYLSAYCHTKFTTIAFRFITYAICRLSILAS
jgi:hypothetical protein